jgi:hypothetical protein
MNEATKALLVGGAASAAGAVIGAVLGRVLGDVVAGDFDEGSAGKKNAEFFGTAMGLAVGAGIGGGIAAWSSATSAAKIAAGSTGAGLVLADSTSSIPNPMRPQCQIVFHCTTDARGAQHCTSEEKCP